MFINNFVNIYAQSSLILFSSLLSLKDLLPSIFFILSFF